MLRGSANSVCFNTSAARTFEKILFCKCPNDSFIFIFSVDHGRGMLLHFLISSKNMLHALRGDHARFGFRCSVGEFLRCERLDVSWKNVLPALRGDHNLDVNV